MNKIQKHFQNVTLVGVASEISKTRCVDHSRHNRIKSAMTKYIYALSHFGNVFVSCYTLVGEEVRPRTEASFHVY